MASCKRSWGSDESLWTVGVGDDVGSGTLQVHLYPFSECSRELAEGVIAPGLKRSLGLLHSESRTNDLDLEPLSDVWCFAYQDYPDFAFDSGSSKAMELLNVFEAFKTWRAETVCTPGVHLLVLEGHRYGLADTPNRGAGVPTAFNAGKDAVVGAAGNLDRITNVAVAEALRTVVDAESVDAVRSLIDPGAAGDPGRAEHQLGTLHGGAASPMATRYEGSDLGSAYGDPSDRGLHAAHGTCSSDADWNGTYAKFLSDCTVRAVLRTRDAAQDGGP